MSRKHQNHLWLLSAAFWSLIGCQPIVAPSAPGQPPTRPANTLTLTTTIPITQEDRVTFPLPSENPQVIHALKDLAQRLNLPVEQIQLTSVEAVVWPDSALGCPKPGMMYAQVLQDGLRIILTANNQVYHYHSGELKPPFLCAEPA